MELVKNSDTPELDRPRWYDLYPGEIVKVGDRQFVDHQFWIFKKGDPGLGDIISPLHGLVQRLSIDE